MVDWAPILDFENYSVSTNGEVVNNDTNTPISISYNREGVPKVTLIGTDHRKYCRSLSLLVARAFIHGVPSHFDSSINLDGDRTNNHISNLALRPRWFAIMYNKQFKPGYQMSCKDPLRDCETGDEYPNSMAVATTFGVLDKDIFISVLNRTFLFPANRMFEFVDW